MVKKIVLLGMLLCAMGICSCSKDGKVEDKTLYSSCNSTSKWNMAESENGFFYEYKNILYYADRENMSKWTPVCNKPDCDHNPDYMTCNAYVEFETLVDVDGKLYTLKPDNGRIFVQETATDGSGSKKVYEIPFEDGIWVNSFSGLFSQEQLVVYYSYLAENGKYQYNLSLLEDKKLHTLHEEELEQYMGSLHMSARKYWQMRGDDVFLSSFLSEDWENTFWRVDDQTKKLEQVRIPESAYPLGSYISGDTFIYFKENEGFYKCDLTSMKEELLFENQLENSRGYILTDEYMVEYNRYSGYMPEEAFLKFYNGKEWIDVEIPEAVSNNDWTFIVEAVASDRIFFKLAQSTPERSECYLYYFMLEEENPILMPSVVMIEGEEVSEEETSESESQGIENGIKEIEDVVVHESEHCKIKIVDVLYENNGVKLYLDWENNSSEDITLMLQSATVNGLQCNPGWGIELKAKDKSSNYARESHYTFVYLDKTDLEEYHITDFYATEEFTNIELSFSVKEWNGNTPIRTYVTVQVYPYGEAERVLFSEEIQDITQMLIENEYMTIAVTGYDNKLGKNDIIHFYIKNKTNERVSLKMIGKSVNGNNIGVEEDVYINGNSCAFKTLDWSRAFKEKGVKAVEELEMKVEVYEAIERIDISKQKFSEEMVLIP